MALAAPDENKMPQKMVAADSAVKDPEAEVCCGSVQKACGSAFDLGIEASRSSGPLHRLQQALQACGSAPALEIEAECVVQVHARLFWKHLQPECLHFV